jgi:hypothetical protein
MANTYYISPQGSDAAAGTLVAPWKTVEKFWATCASGDTLMVREGTAPYVEADSLFDTVTYTTGSQHANPASGGGFSNRLKDNITIRSYALEQPMFTKSTMSTSTKRALWRFYQQTGLVVDGIKTRYTGTWPATGATALPLGSGGIWLHGGLNCLIQNYEAQGSFGAGVSMAWHTESEPTAGASNLARGDSLTIKFAKMYAGAAGVYITAVIHPTVEDTYVEATHMWRDTNVADYGANGIFIGYLARGSVFRRIKFGDCWAVSPQYGIDGGHIESFGVDNTEQHNWEYMYGYGRSMGICETGTNATLRGLNGDNGNVRFAHGLWVGDKIGGSMMLLRANRNWVIENQAWDTVIQSNISNGGIRFMSLGSGFSGGPTGHDGTIIRNNVLRARVSEHPLINFNSGVVVPTGFQERNNILYRAPGTTQSLPAVGVSGGAQVYAYSQPGLASWQASGANRGVADQWVVDPLFADISNADPLLRDYRPAANSPMLGNAHNGGNIGPDVSWLYPSGPPPPPTPSGPAPASTPFFFE